MIANPDLTRAPAEPMAESPTPANVFSAVAPTVDMAPPGPSPDEPTRDSSAHDARRRPVALVEGSEMGLTQETLWVLRRRLRLAAVILFTGVAIFLVKHFFGVEFRTLPGTLFFAFHVVVTIVLGVVGLPLCRRCEISLRMLRVSQWLVFGLPLALMLMLQYHLTLACCRQMGFFDLPAGQWLVLIFTYGLFIPNPPRRAALVIGMMVIAPIGLLIAMLWGHPELLDLLFRDRMAMDRVAGFVIMMIFSAVASVLGVDSIGSLRREAFEARQLGQYRLKQRIGAGGMGEVFLGEHQMLKRPCAIKLIRPDRAGDENVLKRFQREVRATAKLSHWNTVEIFDYGSTDDGTFYYVMEYLPGLSLAELVDRHGPLPSERVIYLLRQACDALTEAHAAGLIHRDIKPGNIFAAQRGGLYDVTKLLDFGLVKPIVDNQSIRLTADGVITGSPLFMSPEQATGDSVADVRTDVYALGAVAYYLLTGRPPFESDRAIKILIAHAHDPVIPPSKHVPDVPADLERVILRCLAKPPADRYQTTAALADALNHCETADRWSPEAAARWWRQNEKGLPTAQDAESLGVDTSTNPL